MRAALRRRAGLLVAALLACGLAACDQDDDATPYLEIAGGGFVFNYRIAEAYYGFVVHVRRGPPEGAVLVAQFEDPAGGPPIELRQPARPGRKGYKFETPALQGIVAGRDYRAELRLQDATGAVLERHVRSFASSADQAVLPARPLTSGPGYHPPPDRPRQD